MSGRVASEDKSARFSLWGCNWHFKSFVNAVKTSVSFYYRPFNN